MTEQQVSTLVNPQNGNLAFRIFTFEDNRYFDHIQRNNYFTIILVRHGEGLLKADFSEYDFSHGSLMSFSPYQPFMLTKTNELQGVALNFHPDFFCILKHPKEVACNGVLFNNIYQPPFIKLEQKDIDLFISLLEQMKTEMQQVGVAQYELLISYLKIFLINASRLKIANTPEIQKEFTDSKEPFILQNLKDAIEENFKVKHTASDYATLLNISASALAKVTKNYFNKTITDLISERIVIEAKRELYLTSKPVKAIAYELGFNDEHYFSRFFKNNAEVSPQMYRETVGFSRGTVDANP